AGLEITEFDGSEADPRQADHRESKRFEDPANLPVSSFVKGHVQGTTSFSEQAGRGRPRRPIIEDHAVTDFFQSNFVRRRIESHAIRLFDFVSRVRESERQWSVVHEKE